MIRQERTQRSAFSMVSNSPEAIAKKGNWPFIAVQYLLQGILGSLPTTMILTYPNIPNYLIIGLFQAVRIPSTIKFTFAPILETYTSVFYGKRKLWIMLSGSLMGLFLLLASFYTDQAHQVFMSILFFFSMIFCSCADIAVDALALKEIVLPEKISYVQTASKKIGHIIGGFIFLKLVSVKFASYFGVNHSFTTVSTFLRIVGISFIVLQVFTHFFYKQEILQEEIEKKDVGLCDTLKQYKVFFNWKDKYFRTGIFLMSTVFGLLFFHSSYQYELMKRGFSRQRVNQIQTISAFPMLGLGYYFSTLCTKENMYKLTFIIVAARMANFVIAYIFQPTGSLPIISYLFIEEVLHSMSGLLDGIIINYFPVTALSGMMITMLNSMKNFGHNFTFHLFVVNTIGHRTASLIGFILHAIFLLFAFKPIVKWVKEGEQDTRLPIVYNEESHRGPMDHNRVNEDQRLDDFDIHPVPQQRTQDQYKKRMSAANPTTVPLGIKSTKSMHQIDPVMFLSQKKQRSAKKQKEMQNIISVIQQQEKEEKKPSNEADIDRKSEVSQKYSTKEVPNKKSNDKEEINYRQNDQTNQRKFSKSEQDFNAANYRNNQPK